MNTPSMSGSKLRPNTPPAKMIMIKSPETNMLIIAIVIPKRMSFARRNMMVS